MIRINASFLFILLFRLSFGQLSAFEFDTINHQYAILGNLDTFDLTARSFSSSFLFPNESKNNYTIQPAQLFYPGNSLYSFSNLSDKNLIFSALPHIGFGYTFGGQATQKLDFDYEQTFKHGFLINVAIHNFKTDGFFRNTNAQNNLYELALARNGKIHAFQLRVNSEKIQRNWNGGIQNDSLVDSFSPNLIQIFKENAQSIYKNSRIDLKNKFSLIKDSIRQIGLSTMNDYNRFRRFYFEEDSISSLYSKINIDSSITNDSLLQQTFNNNIGFFLKTHKFNLESGLSSTYWNYRAFEYRNDTLELGIYTQIDFEINKLTFHQKGNFNLRGAANGFHNFISANGHISGFDLKIEHHLKNEFPIIFQRFLYSNNTNYKTHNLEKQWFQNVNIKVGKTIGNQAIQLAVNLAQFRKVYQFDTQQQIWRNDLNSSIGTYQQFSLKSILNWRSFNCHLNYQFTAINEKKRFTPTHIFNSRVFIKGGIFKAKKLKAIAGLDFILTSSYRRLNFLPQMTLFDLENSSFNPISSGFMNVAAFTSFEVAAFRLFLRLDNLAYFWQNRNIELISGYTFPSAQLKVGITWDFWN